MPAELIRRAVPGDRQQLIALLDRTFTDRPFSESFGEHFPQFFADAAIGQHHLAYDGGNLIGCVGAYPFAATLHGQALRVGGVGQVGTAPEARGRGIMTRLLDAALGSAGEVDLWWLYGDAQRYGRIGFAPGGEQVEMLAWSRYTRSVALAGPPIRELDLQADDALIARMLDEQPFVVQQERSQRAQMLAGKGVRGWTDGAAVLLLDPSGRTSWCQRGEPAALARLVAHQIARRHGAAPRDSALSLQVDPGDGRTLAALQPLCGELISTATASFRIGRLLPLLRAWGAASPPPPGNGLRASVLDGGAAGCVRISSVHDRWQIEAHDGPAELRYEGAALARLIMGGLPIAAFALPHDGALRHLLPLRFHIPRVYAL